MLKHTIRERVGCGFQSGQQPYCSTWVREVVEVEASELNNPSSG